MMILSTAASIGTFCGIWSLVKKIDQEYREKERCFVWFLLYALSAPLMTGAGGILRGIFWGSLATAAYSDLCTCKVYDFVYFPAIVSSAIRFLSLMGQQFSMAILLDTVLFIVLQLFLFRRFYGDSDVLAYITCSLSIAADGRGMFDSLVLMAVTFMMLAIIQAAKKNVNRKGNLKIPVALIPYIAIAMLLYSILRR